MNLSPKVNYQQLEADNKCYFYNLDSAPDFKPEYFLSRHWQQQDAIIGTAQGRGTTWFIKHEAQQWVLKHYYRGGLIGKILKDSYLFTGIAQTRSVAEFKLLSQLIEHKLPAPTPIACAVKRTGLCYQADLLTSRIANAKDLVAILSEQTVDKQLWQKVGKVVKRFHDHGVYHHDLNIHNILIDEQEKVWLIDFDRGKVIKPAAKWQQANIARLQRSFFKEQNRLDKFYWQKEDFDALMLGYQST